jgi:hypothetical protein
MERVEGAVGVPEGEIGDVAEAVGRVNLAIEAAVAPGDVALDGGHEIEVVERRRHHGPLRVGPAGEADGVEQRLPGAGRLLRGVGEGPGRHLRSEVLGGLVGRDEGEAHLQLDRARRQIEGEGHAHARAARLRARRGGHAIVPDQGLGPGGAGAGRKEDVVPAKAVGHASHGVEAAPQAVAGGIEGDLGRRHGAAVEVVIEIEDHLAGGGPGRVGVAVVGGVHRGGEVDGDAVVEGDRIVAGRGRLGGLLEGGAVSSRGGDGRIEGGDGHQRQHAVVGGAGAVQVQVGEAEDGVVAVPVAGEVQESDGAPRPLGVGSDLDEALGRGRAHGGAAHAVGEAAAADEDGRDLRGLAPGDGRAGRRGVDGDPVGAALRAGDRSGAEGEEHRGAGEGAHARV